MAPLILPFAGKQPVIDPNSFVAANASVIGDVQIGAESSLWFGVVLRGDVNRIQIGRQTNIQDGTVVHVSSGSVGVVARPTTIGDRVTVGHAAILHACELQDEAYVGMGAVVLDGAVVEGGGFLAAGALLTSGKVVRRGELWAGNPAKLLRPLRPEESAFIPQSAAHYWQLALAHKNG
jgi:carbonic anhydrase/acetyltransferase-like protein (isoleucine patch superfamily)